MIALLGALRIPAAGGWMVALLAGPAPLTNEDVVRLVVHGTPEKTILREIEARPVAFDLSAGVVEELARVGVTPAIIEAMRRRQAAMAPAADAASAPAGAPPRATGTPSEGAVLSAPAAHLTLAFAGPAAGTGREPDPIVVIASLPEGPPLPDGAEVGALNDLALAILCTTGDHVPDHWDTRTPLTGAPRHEVLLFRPGATAGRHKGVDVITLRPEPAGPVALPPGVHALLVGLAGRPAGSGAWRLLAFDRIRVDLPPGGSVRLVVEARTAPAGARPPGPPPGQVWTVRQEPEIPQAGAAP